jgi:hypothetical protein
MLTPLFRSSSVEVLAVGLRVGASVVELPCSPQHLRLADLVTDSDDGLERPKRLARSMHWTSRGSSFLPKRSIPMTFGQEHPSPDLKPTAADKSYDSGSLSGRRSNIVPPLPRRTASPKSIDAASVESPEIDGGAAQYTPSLPPIAVDATEPHHRLNVWTALTLITGAAVLLTPILVGSHREPAQPEPARHGVPLATSTPQSEVNGPIVEQFVQLDEVVIASRGENVDMPENMPAQRAFDRSAALSAIRTVGACLVECGPRAVGSANVVVTFAPSGEVTNAAIEDGPLQGEPEGGCVARHLRDVRVPAFDAEPVTVRTALTLGP